MLILSELSVAGPGGTTPAVNPRMSADNAFAKALARECLNSAWQEILRKSSARSRKTLGSDDQSIDSFNASSANNVTNLSRVLRSGQFNFQSLRPYLIPKTNGKFRLICVPTVRDRIVQRALVEYLSQKYHSQLANKVSYGFIKGRSVKNAATTACELRSSKPWVFKTDITAFFDNINRETLMQSLRTFVRDRSLHSILYSALSCEVEASTNGTNRRIDELGIRRGQGVRQGMPLSPFFSNVLLIKFDNLLQQKNISAIRYADDMIFFAKDESECRAIADFCANELSKIGLTIPPIEPKSKSVIYTPDEPADFLGLEMRLLAKRYELRLSSQQIIAIRDELLKLGSVNELLSRGLTLKTLGPTLGNKINGYLAAYSACTNFTEVENELLDVEQLVLRRVYTDGLGIDLTKLNGSGRTFLGLIDRNSRSKNFPSKGESTKAKRRR